MKWVIRLILVSLNQILQVWDVCFRYYCHCTRQDCEHKYFIAKLIRNWLKCIYSSVCWLNHLHLSSSNRTVFNRKAFALPMEVQLLNETCTVVCLNTCVIGVFCAYGSGLKANHFRHNFRNIGTTVPLRVENDPLYSSNVSRIFHCNTLLSWQHLKSYETTPTRHSTRFQFLSQPHLQLFATVYYQIYFSANHIRKIEICLMEL